METWKTNVRHPKYEINTNGDIRNSRTGRILKPSDVKGYKQVALYDEHGKRHHRYVHDLVAETFIENVDNKPQVNHIDCDKSNNSINNLEWCTCKENIQHAVDNGLRSEYAGKPKVKVRIVETGQVFESTRECARAINGSNGHVSNCINGKRCKHKGLHFEPVYD